MPHPRARTTCWAVAAAVSLAAAGCSGEQVGRYQPVGEIKSVDSLGPILFALDTQTGRLCVAVAAKELVKKTLIPGVLCDTSLQER